MLDDVHFPPNILHLLLLVALLISLSHRCFPPLYALSRKINPSLNGNRSTNYVNNT